MHIINQLSAEDFARHYQPLKNRFELLENLLAQLYAEIGHLTVQAASAGAVISEAKELSHRWPDMSFEEKRSIIEVITEQIVIGKETIHIKLAHIPSFLLSKQHNYLHDPHSIQTANRYHRHK